MGLFSFLFGGKKKAAPRPTPMVVELAPTSSPIAVAPANAGIVQAKLRLKLAASLRGKQHADAYQAATQLAEIQMRAGRKTVARVWRQEAERIKAEGGLVA